jgi:hypothetical protein
MIELLRIPYRMILERRPKAVKLDLGEQEPAWFPLHRIELDEAGYTVTAERALIGEKLGTARGGGVDYRDADERPVKLAQPAWENETAIGIDVRVVRLDNKARPIRTRVFFAKSKLKDGAAPAWLVKRKEEVLTELTEKSPFTADDFAVRGLRARRKNKGRKQRMRQKEFHFRSLMVQDQDRRYRCFAAAEGQRRQEPSMSKRSSEQIATYAPAPAVQELSRCPKRLPQQ